mgnify:CR=1 FL=1
MQAGQAGATEFSFGDRSDDSGNNLEDRFGLDGVDRRVPGTERYEAIVENKFFPVASRPLSTFSIDVDTASYTNVRRFLNQGRLPPPSAVRIEEMVNYFRYDYAPPDDETPFSVDTEVAQCPWRAEHRLLRVGLKGREIERDQRGPTNLVFLLDVSGSMRDQNKLPLVKRAMRLLVDELNEDDRVAIVTYASNAGLKLESTCAAEKSKIIDAIDALSAGGSTHGSAGIQLAYEQAAQHFVEGGTNRVDRVGAGIPVREQNHQSVPGGLVDVTARALDGIHERREHLLHDLVDIGLTVPFAEPGVALQV